MKKICIGAIIIICVFCIGACGSEKQDKNNEDASKQEEMQAETEENAGEKNVDIDNILNMDIDEARIYWADKEYSTKDEEIIKELVNKIAALELYEVDKEDVELLDGDYNLSLYYNSQEIYSFISDGVTLRINGKCYRTEEGIQKSFDSVVIQYCKDTFWN